MQGDGKVLQTAMMLACNPPAGKVRGWCRRAVSRDAARQALRAARKQGGSQLLEATMMG